ncbi:sugar ABC transporter substrate-binding protein [Orenia metallireducens]|uniref:Sugar ABC transporter substrate-binding protein n=1 Tax=Orenia metallireducens TaxID=1413210 RepID=A0A1C0ACQ8_9FIRM|nr:substrate-binding domain-containing protein [Orenia metallireducens]OCL28429.1 sugar ABC transporter substrate-binding protein [Orenia metallireducens]
MSRKSRIIILMFLILIFGGCQFSVERINPFTIPIKSKSPIVIGISMANIKEDVSKVMKEAIMDYKTKVNADIIWKNANNDITQQEEDIKSLIEQQVDIIIFHAVRTDEQGKKIVKLINQHNIPIIALDRLPEDSKVDAYISADNFKAGQLQTRYLLDQIDKKGNIIILKGDKNINVTDNITIGNKSELKNNEEIKIIKEEFHHNWSRKSAKETVNKILNKNKEINGILANNDNLALGALDAIEGNNMRKKIIVVGADASKEASIAIAKENLAATIDKMPYTMGKKALMVASFILRDIDWNWDRTIKNGEYNIKLIISPVKLIDKYNIEILEDRWGNLPIKE